MKMFSESGHLQFRLSDSDQRNSIGDFLWLVPFEHSVCTGTGENEGLWIVLRWRRDQHTHDWLCPQTLPTEAPAGAVGMPTELGAVFSATRPHPPSCDPQPEVRQTFTLDSITGIFQETQGHWWQSSRLECGFIRRAWEHGHSGGSCHHGSPPKPLGWMEYHIRAWSVSPRTPSLTSTGSQVPWCTPESSFPTGHSHTPSTSFSVQAQQHLRGQGSFP